MVYHHVSNKGVSASRLFVQNKKKLVIIWKTNKIIRYLSKYKIIMNDIFKALNDPIRRQIIELLKNKSMSVGEIYKNFNITMPTLSHHLDKLKRAELLTSEKKGQFVFYTLNMTILEEVLNWVIKIKN